MRTRRHHPQWTALSDAEAVELLGPLRRTQLRAGERPIRTTFARELARDRVVDPGLSTTTGEGVVLVDGAEPYVMLSVVDGRDRFVAVRTHPEVELRRQRAGGAVIADNVVTALTGVASLERPGATTWLREPGAVARALDDRVVTTTTRTTPVGEVFTDRFAVIPLATRRSA